MNDEKLRQPSSRIERVRQFALVEFNVNKYALSGEQRVVFRHLASAADFIDTIFRKQFCPDYYMFTRYFKEEFSKDRELEKYFEINYGPYDILEDYTSFLPVGPRSLGAGFYPPDLTKEEFLAFLEKYPKKKDALQSPYTLVKRDRDGLCAIPYHEAYADDVKRAAAALMEASVLESREAARHYFASRAKALEIDDYYASNVQWIDLPPDGLDIVIGPDEVYEDRLLGLKAAYEAIITYQDPSATEQVRGFFTQLAEFHRYLTTRVDLEFDPPGPSTPMIIADLLYSAGDARKGIPAIGFALPNDENVIQEKGTKQVILRNVLHAKFQHILLPILEVVYGGAFDGMEAFEGFFKQTVVHEIAHALGPHRITVAGVNTTVNRALRDLHSTLEEAKADVLANYWLLHRSGRVSQDTLPPVLASYLPGLLRAIRFGLGEVHGRANLLQFNYLVHFGAIQISDRGWPSISPPMLEEGLRMLAGEILRIQCEGSYEAAERMRHMYCQPTQITQGLVKRLAHLPIDIAIGFSGLDE